MTINIQNFEKFQRNFYFKDSSHVNEWISSDSCVIYSCDLPTITIYNRTEKLLLLLLLLLLRLCKLNGLYSYSSTAVGIVGGWARPRPSPYKSTYFVVLFTAGKWKIEKKKKKRGVIWYGRKVTKRSRSSSAAAAAAAANEENWIFRSTSLILNDSDWGLL